ncbi:hypothetical protein Poly41_23010 [Novipirellula artificiosorum]|uniref:Uncharacterized protein n=2 Tax=Novipirellula artificiosorum TaxID=2528016 RepID=A0A5C6DU92_9BACT|nr:hypothetical protein Poly41_23010 [Novipirellula artificiosorum]
MPFVYCLLFALPLTPSGIYICSNQMNRRYRLAPEPVFRTFIHTVPASVSVTIVVCCPLFFIMGLYAFVLLVPLTFAAFVAGTVHLAYTEVVRDQFPPTGGQRSDTP